MPNAAPIVPHAVPHTNTWVQEVLMTQASGSRRSGTIQIKDDRNRHSSHKWDATYEVRDSSWTITADGAMLGNSAEHVANNASYPFVMDSLGNEGIKSFLCRWLDYYAKGHVEERLETHGEIRASKPVSPDDVLSSSPPPPVPAQQPPQVPKPARPASQPVVLKPQPQSEVTPKPEQAMQAPALQPKKEKIEMTPIKDPVLRKLVNTVCKTIGITKKQLRDTSNLDGSGGRKIVCNLGSYLYKRRYEDVANAAGFKNPVQVNQTRDIEDAELNASLLKVKEIMLKRYPEPSGAPSKASAKSPVAPKKRKNSQRAANPRSPAPEPVVPKIASATVAGMNGEFNAIVYTVFELRGRNVQAVAKAFGITEAEVNGAVVAIMQTLGGKFAEVSIALSKCG